MLCSTFDIRIVKEHVLVDISHDLPSPLSRVRNAAELQEENTHAKVITKEIELLDRVIETILKRGHVSQKVPLQQSKIGEIIATLKGTIMTKFPKLDGKSLPTVRILLSCITADI